MIPHHYSKSWHNGLQGPMPSLANFPSQTMLRKVVKSSSIMWSVLQFLNCTGGNCWTGKGVGGVFLALEEWTQSVLVSKCSNNCANVTFINKHIWMTMLIFHRVLEPGISSPCLKLLKLSRLREAICNAAVLREHDSGWNKAILWILMKAVYFIFM